MANISISDTSKARLVIGFIYPSKTQLNNILEQRYVTIGESWEVSIYADKYGWTTEQKQAAFEEVERSQQAALMTAKSVLNDYLFKFARLDSVVVGIPVAQVGLNGYMSIVTNQTNPNTEVDFKLTTAEIDIFKNIVAALKEPTVPQFYFFIADK